MSETKEQPSCATCDLMRHEGNTMRCYADPPTGVVLGVVPARLQGAAPTVIISGAAPEVHPLRFCRWHPEIRLEGSLRSPGVEVRDGEVLPPDRGATVQGPETRQ